MKKDPERFLGETVVKLSGDFKNVERFFNGKLPGIKRVRITKLIGNRELRELFC